ncbi:hypothetical protein GGH94_004801, partial [Coemansia aciculifera]
TLVGIRAGEEVAEDEEDANQGIGAVVVADRDLVVGEEWEEDLDVDAVGDLASAMTTRITGKPSSPTPWASIAWRVLYVVPPNARSELGLAGEKIPGPFSPPLHPSTPEQAANAGPRKPQDVLRKQNEVYAMKQRVQQLLQQAADSPSGGIGTYVGRLSHNNNPLIPVLPRLDP